MSRLSSADLIARAEITDTAYANSRGVDRCDYDLLIYLITTDAVLYYGNGRITQGHEALRGLFHEATGKYTSTNHHCSTVAFHELTDTYARTTTYVYAFHDDSTGDRHVHVWGNYEDQWRNEDDRWRITERTVRVAGVKTTQSEEIPDRFELFVRGATE
jgi:ketosteroid isomerase-like protein